MKKNEIIFFSFLWLVIFLLLCLQSYLMKFGNDLTLEQISFYIKANPSVLPDIFLFAIFVSFPMILLLFLLYKITYTVIFEPKKIITALPAILKNAIILLLFISIYFIPSGVSLVRKHHNTTAIILLNLFLGVTGVFWVVALIWAFTNPPQVQIVEVRENAVK